MMQIIDGKRYNTLNAELLATNGYRSQSIYGTQLYVTKKGAFFFFHWSNMQGETDSIEPVRIGEAFNFFCKHWGFILDSEKQFETARLKYFKNLGVEEA